MKKLKQINLKIIIITLITLFSFQLESFSQIKKYKEKRSFGYLSFQTGNFSQSIIDSNYYFGLNYRSKLAGNFGFETGLGFFNANEDYVQGAKSNRFPTNLNSAGDMANGLNFNLNINYVLGGSKFGVIPKFGIMTSSTSSFGFYYDGRRNIGEAWHYANDIRPVAGMDIYIKKFIIGTTYDIWYGGAFLQLGYLVSNKDKNNK